MKSYIDYSREQKNIINSIIKIDKYDEKTRLLVLMATNNYVRTIDDLVGILSQYPSMPIPSKLKSIAIKCINEHYLSERKYYDEEYCLMEKEGYWLFISTLPPEIQDQISDCRKIYRQSECVKVLGLLSGGDNKGYLNKSFWDLLESAQFEILLPMFNTVPNNNVMQILRKQAAKGVKIKILLPDYDKVVKKIRGSVENYTIGWIGELKDIENIEIHIFNKVEDTLIYSSVIVDRRIARFCVFDYNREKSSNGTLIEIEKNGYDLNLINILIDRFNEIWIRTRNINEKKYLYFIKNKKVWMLIGSIIFSILLFYTEDIMQEIVLAIDSAFVTALCISIKTEVLEKISKFYKMINKM